MSKRERPGYISLSIELPIEVAEFLGSHGDKLVSVIRRAVSDYKANPPDPDGNIHAEREQRHKELFVKLEADGRLGYRLLRQKIGTETYIAHDGGIRNRFSLSKTAWRRVILKDLANELELGFSHLEIVIRRFRKDLHQRIKTRRETWTLRYHLAGFTDGEIALRLGVTYPTISLFIKAARPEIFKMLRENPEIRAEMQALVGMPVKTARRQK